MENFDWTKFTKKIAIKAPLSYIYKAWTTTAEIENWFLSKAVFLDSNGQSIQSTMPIENGFTYEWNWYLYQETERGTILQANGIDYLQFTFAGDCIVDITLSIQNEYTIVELTQKNIPVDENSKKNIRLGCASGWSFFLVNLKSVYEGGLDLRNKDTSLSVMVNN